MDRMRGTTVYTKPKQAVPDATFHVKSLGDCWISSKNIDYQRILQSDCKRDTTGHTQPKVFVKKSKISVDSF